MADECRVEKIFDEFAAKKVSSMGVEEIVAGLREQRISTLEDLVAARLRDFEHGGDVAKDTFIYSQFVYKSERPLPDDLLDLVENRIREHFER